MYPAYNECRRTAMSVAHEKTQMSLAELLASPDAGRFEIVDGELGEVDVSNYSTHVAGKLFRFLGNFCDSHPLGEVLAMDAYYQCFGHDETRAYKPDVSFIARERLPHD